MIVQEKITEKERALLDSVYGSIRNWKIEKLKLQFKGSQLELEIKKLGSSEVNFNDLDSIESALCAAHDETQFISTVPQHKLFYSILEKIGRPYMPPIPEPIPAPLERGIFSLLKGLDSGFKKPMAEELPIKKLSAWDKAVKKGLETTRAEQFRAPGYERDIDTGEWVRISDGASERYRVLRDTTKEVNAFNNEFLNFSEYGEKQVSRKLGDKLEVVPLRDDQGVLIKPKPSNKGEVLEGLEKDLKGRDIEKILDEV